MPLPVNQAIFVAVAAFSISREMSMPQSIVCDKNQRSFLESVLEPDALSLSEGSFTINLEIQRARSQKRGWGGRQVSMHIPESARHLIDAELRELASSDRHSVAE